MIEASSPAAQIPAATQKPHWNPPVVATAGGVALLQRASSRA